MNDSAVEEVVLSGKHGTGRVALIDVEGISLVSPFTWSAELQKIHSFDQFYARTNVGGKWMYMHRLLLGLRPGDPMVDHVNGEGLDNRRCNLRRCTNSLNQANRLRPTRANASSIFRGVTWHKGVRKWQAVVGVMGTNHYLGVFESEVEAATAYNVAALKYFGSFARLNQVERVAI